MFRIASAEVIRISINDGENASLLITTNLAFTDWPQVFN
jgi:hypothetical protein